MKELKKCENCKTQDEYIEQEFCAFCGKEGCSDCFDNAIMSFYITNDNSYIEVDISGMHCGCNFDDLKDKIKEATTQVLIKESKTNNN